MQPARSSAVRSSRRKNIKGMARSRSLEIDSSRARGAAMMRELLRAMRPKEWIKNIFIFAAIAFARNPDTQTPLWQELDRVLVVCAAFVLFCMVASAIYLINDLVD